MKKLIGVACAVTLLLLIAASARAEITEPFLLLDEQGNTITQVCYEPEAGDEYIAGDNRHYRVISVDMEARTARMEALGVIQLPDMSHLDDAVTVSSEGKTIAIYCTHSDESYEPTDGAASLEKRGGIYDVAEVLADALRAKGITVNASEENHSPHDAGAYRRSRATAAQLLEQGADALIDLHRDGIPDPDEYETTVNGEETSRVRLLVGRSNQNSASNKIFATQLKAVADKVYPGLIKDIYIGKGSYNQDLYPRAILLEIGTHTIDKTLATEAAERMADVISRTLYGGTTGSAGASDIGKSQSAPADEADGGLWTGLWIVLGIAVLGLLIYGFVSTGSLGGMFRGAGRALQQMGGGLFGRGKHRD